MTYAEEVATTRTGPAPAYRLPHASPSLRIVAGILDFIVVISLFMLFVAVAGLQVLARSDWGANANYPDQANWVGVGILIGYALLMPLYFIIPWSWRGQTLGMMGVRIMVTRRDGERLSFWRAVLRTLVWPLSIVPLGLGLVPMFTDSESRALHDMLAGTVVLEIP